MAKEKTMSENQRRNNWVSWAVNGRPSWKEGDLRDAKEASRVRGKGKDSEEQERRTENRQEKTDPRA